MHLISMKAILDAVIQFPHYVIDIANNNLRVVALIFFESQKFYVRHVFTHKEYDRFTEKHRTKGKK